MLSKRVAVDVGIAVLVCVIFLGALSLLTFRAPETDGEETNVAPATVGEKENVILMGWDGVQRDHLFEMLGRDELPNLQAIIGEGRAGGGAGIVNMTIVDHRTNTKPGWAQILTGYRWYHTGVFSNNVFFHPIPDGYTILERVEAHYGKANVATAMITGKQKHIPLGPEASCVYYHGGIFSNVPEDIDVTQVEEADANVTGPRMIDFLDNHGTRRFFAFFHFRDTDRVGHGKGENSREYELAAILQDEVLGQVVGKLKELKVYDKTLLYVTTDHGFDEGETKHKNAPHVWLVTNDAVVKHNGDLVDVAPTVYYGMGLWGEIAFDPPLDGYPLQLGVPRAEVAARERAFNDVTPPIVSIISPTAEVTLGSIDQVTVEASDNVTIDFVASDENLIVVLLLIDNRLEEVYERHVKGNWTQDGVTSLAGSYTWMAPGDDEGSYIITVMAFDEGPNPLPPAWGDEKPVPQSKITVRVAEQGGSIDRANLPANWVLKPCPPDSLYRSNRAS